MGRGAIFTDPSSSAQTSTEATTAATTEPTTTSAANLKAQGKEVFASAGCGGCHTLADAGATGTVGPNLDDAKPKPSRQLVTERATNGMGTMPAFEGQLSDVEIQAVAAYVSQAAGG